MLLLQWGALIEITTLEGENVSERARVLKTIITIKLYIWVERSTVIAINASDYLNRANFI